MQLKLITPTEQTFAGEISSATLPGSLGQMTILPGHTSLVSSLCAGLLKINSSNGVQEFELGKGLVEVKDNEVTVLVHSAAAVS